MKKKTKVASKSKSKKSKPNQNSRLIAKKAAARNGKSAAAFTNRSHAVASEVAAQTAGVGKPMIELQSVDTFFELVDGQPTLRHKRRFTNTSSDQIIFLLMGMKFFGPGGLMVSSTADSEECSADGKSREIKNFKPLGRNPTSLVAGSFNIRQQLLELSLGPQGLVAAMQMSFTPTDPDGPGPWGSLLWYVEPDRSDPPATHACWSDLINCEETISRRVPALRVKAGSAEILMELHNRLIGGAAKRVAQVLNSKTGKDVVYAEYVKSGRLNCLHV